MEEFFFFLFEHVFCMLWTSVGRLDFNISQYLLQNKIYYSWAQKLQWIPCQIVDESKLNDHQDSKTTLACFKYSSQQQTKINFW